MQAARLGVALAVVAPVGWFAALWFARGGSADGFVVAMIDGAIASALDLIAHAAANPVAAAAYVALAGAAWKFAFGR